MNRYPCFALNYIRLTHWNLRLLTLSLTNYIVGHLIHCAKDTVKDTHWGSLFLCYSYQLLHFLMVFGESCVDSISLLVEWKFPTGFRYWIRISLAKSEINFKGSFIFSSEFSIGYTHSGKKSSGWCRLCRSSLPRELADWSIFVAYCSLLSFNSFFLFITFIAFDLITNNSNIRLKGIANCIIVGGRNCWFGKGGSFLGMESAGFFNFVIFLILNLIYFNNSNLYTIFKLANEFLLIIIKYWCFIIVNYNNFFWI